LHGIANRSALHESVTWFCPEAPVEIFAAQIKAFAELYAPDVHPLQPLNGRVVKDSII
jgi:carbonic anhydrase